MTPVDALSDLTQSTQIDATAPRFFLDPAIDANPDDGDWWLDIGGVDLPGSLAV
ncbi:hypothetical protein VT84_29240 [Gemmata sp. SH-PL17]|uniref:Uncharacterized protein n=1 Tax=Gemmata massiliana TaxID=1210884 RepID=A0A6P2CSV0_9BACT|nr:MULTISPECIES: hypothetical protein [Gemmata]AMV28526.1 hypothetical protein VT84_29240 [Gemmata sp. SH-PL17]VTR92188.1 unnamed protein product [Gemmata massiliana]